MLAGSWLSAGWSWQLQGSLPASQLPADAWKQVELGLSAVGGSQCMLTVRVVATVARGLGDRVNDMARGLVGE